MESLSLACPLCCNETFLTHDSLRVHILQTVDNMDNLACPSCNEKCADLIDLADHLGRECINLATNKNQTLSAKTPKKEIGRGTLTSQVADLTRIKTEAGDSIEIDTVGVRAEETRDETVALVNPDEITDDPSMIYSCEVCNTTFSSVKKHLAKFHEGEEVILETEETENDVDNNSVDGHSSPVDDVFDERPAEQNSRRNNIDASEQDTATDDDDDDGGDVSPVTTYYIVEEGKVRSLSSEEVERFDDKTRLIQVHRCPNCQLQFPNLDHFKKHKCKHVKKVSKKKRDIAEKKIQVQKIKENFRYQCAFCQAVYTTLIALNDHSKSHLIEDDTGFVHKKKITMYLNVCEVCNTKFPTYKQLRLHSRMHKSSSRELESASERMDAEDAETDQFECPICYKIYERKYEVDHMKSHEDDEHLTCLVCNRKFDSQSSLDMHKNAHSNTKKLTCTYCKKGFNNYEALEEHSTKQCQKREFECQFCGRRFSKPHEKVKHERIHTGEKPHVCEICNKSFRISYCLTLHMRSHTGNRPYGCTKCEKRFKSYSVYNHHMKIHSEDRNYKCSFCPKAFKTAVQLAGHKNSHTKPFTCTECNRPFASLYAVRAHMDTHKRDNNLRHDCFVCGASYARSYALKDHIKEAHPNVNPDEEINEDKMARRGLEGVTKNLDLESSQGQEHGDLVEDGENQTEETDCQVIEENDGTEYEVQL